MFKKKAAGANRSRDDPPLEQNPPQGQGQGPPAQSVLRELLSLLGKIAAIAIAAALAFTFVYGFHRAAGGDMAPAVKDGDLVLFYRLDRDYAAGDLVLLSFRGERQVSRVMATQGDTVDITERGLMINGSYQQEPGIYEETPRYEQGADFPITLGASQVFVLGDSRGSATDSRIYGAVDTSNTLGTVIAVVRRRNF